MQINKQNHFVILSFLYVASSLISPWLCLSFAVAVSLSPQNPKSLYAMVMFACSEIGRSTKPTNPRATSIRKDGVMQVRTICPMYAV